MVYLSTTQLYNIYKKCLFINIYILQYYMSILYNFKCTYVLSKHVVMHNTTFL